MESTSSRQGAATRLRYLQVTPAPSLTMALNAEINVTPMIDVLLVLLVVFMISIQFRSLLPLNVPPPADQAKPGRASPQVVLELKEDGSFAINGTVTPLDALFSRLSELAAGGKRNLFEASTGFIGDARRQLEARVRPRAQDTYQSAIET